MHTWSVEVQGGKTSFWTAALADKNVDEKTYNVSSFCLPVLCFYSESVPLRL